MTLTADLIIRGLDIHIIHKMSHWDACVVIAASAAGCKELWSEDLHTGAVIEGVKIVNPLIQSYTP